MRAPAGLDQPDIYQALNMHPSSIGGFFDDIVDSGLALLSDDDDDPSGGGTGLSAGEAQTPAGTPQGPGGAFPAFAGNPQIFANRIAKLNRVMGSNFALSTHPLDPSLMSTVSRFQSGAAITVDGKMGQQTEGALDRRLGGAAPAAPAGNLPAPSSPTLPAQNVAATDNKKTMLLVGAGVAALLIVGLVLTKKKKKKS